MKKNYFLTLAFLFTVMGFSQIVNIPDANFKAKLLAANTNNEIAKNSSNDNIKIDSNNDSEIQVSEALIVYSLDVNGSNILDMTGISAFQNLTNLVCYDNQLVNLSLSGLSNLEILTCYENEITNLSVSGLSNLTEFDCHDNNLSSLSVVNLTNLLFIDCSQNQLTSLTLSGLVSLLYVIASTNQLSVLNLTNCPIINTLNCNNNLFANLNITGINSITQLFLDSNQLTSLSVLELNNLSRLSCSNNQLTMLNVVGTNLDSLNCSNNQLTNLNIFGLENLNLLDCSNNQLGSLNVSNLSGLEWLNCSNNQLTALDVAGLSDLFTFDCSNNQLTTIDLSSAIGLDEVKCHNNLLNQILLPANLDIYRFYCQNNQLTSLPPLAAVFFDCSFNFLTTLTVIDSQNINCSHNQLTSINLPSGPSSSYRLDCSFNLLETYTAPVDDYFYGYLDISNNNLIAMYFNNATIYEDTGGAMYLNLANNPNLQYICANPEDIAILQDVVDEYGYDSCEINSYCTFTPGGTFYTIQGNHKFDFNANGCDVNDVVVQNQKFTITDGTTTGSIVSDGTGNYNIRVQAGSHTITPVLENPTYFNITPNSLPVVFPSQTSPINQNFCIAPNGVHPDLEVVLIPTNSAGPGFDVTYKIIYKNKGTNTQSGNINFNFDDAVLDFVSSSPATDSQLTNNLNWSFSNLEAFSSGEIFFTLNLNTPMEVPPVNGGDILNSSVLISSAATDEAPSDNSATLSQTVFNSFDPNDKTCLEGASITPEMIGNYVHYKIRFENTGTANAQRIIVSDKIDLSKFDISTLVPIDGSHAFTTRVYDGNKVEFIFENIQLPFDDENNDGYVVFKIKTLPTLVLGDSFSNSAAIYFDYNYPIFTNEAVTTIQVLGTPDFDFGNYFTLYPNPASDVLNIASKEEITITSIAIYNTLGQLVITVPNAQKVSSIDVSNLTTGSYFIKVASDKGSSSMRFIKN